MNTKWKYETRCDTSGALTSTLPYFPPMDAQVIQDLGLEIFRVYDGEDFDPVLHQTCKYNYDTGGWEDI